jgi:hypothetical protein
VIIISHRLAAYMAVVDALCAQRRVEGWEPKNDRPLLAILEDQYELLTEAEREYAEKMGFRAWPDRLDDEMNTRIHWFLAFGLVVALGCITFIWSRMT